jgi:superfamily I DNA/RNA helicase
MPIALDSLNPEQRAAVEVLDGPLLVLAGAGTGKTRVITYRIANLIAHGAAPRQILAVTFTNKAAREMRDRVETLLGNGTARDLTIGTFHAFGARLLRRHITRLGISSGFEIAGDAFQVGLIRNILAETGIQSTYGDPHMFLGAISRAKSSLTPPAPLSDTAANPWHQALAQVYDLYERRLHNMDLLDFDDLLVMLIRLWEQAPDLLGRHRDQFRFVLVDEYQDTNTVQFQIVATLAGEHRNLCVVGDDDQSIYGWRGAEVGHILSFEQQFPGARVVRLQQNYRSTGTILRAANAVIARNTLRHHKELWSEQGQGEPILAVSAADEEEEARFIAQHIKDLGMLERRPYADYAVLYRSNHQSRLLETALRQEKVPYTIVGSSSFFERKEILDAIALLHCVENPRNDLALLRILNVPPRGIGDTSIGRIRELQQITGLPLQQLLADPDALAQLPGQAATGINGLLGTIHRTRETLHRDRDLAGGVKRFLQDVGYLDGLGRMYKPRADALRRRENVDEFVNAAAAFAERHAPLADLSAFLESVTLQDQNDRTRGTREADQDSVTLMTVHAAKGLEFPVVFLAGLESGLFPHQQSVEENRLEEERRLFYVAVTRARERLLITHAQHRRVQGQRRTRRPSPFLNELPEDTVNHSTTHDAVAPAPPEVADDFLERMRRMFQP